MILNFALFFNSKKDININSVKFEIHQANQTARL